MEFESIKSALEERIGAKIDMIKRCGSAALGIDSEHDIDILLFTKERVNEKHFHYDGYDVFVRDREEEENIKNLNFKTLNWLYITSILATFDDEIVEYMGWNPLDHKTEILEHLRPILKGTLFHRRNWDKNGYQVRQDKRMCYALALMYKFQNNSLELTEEQLQHVINAHDKCVDEEEIDKAEEFYGIEVESWKKLTRQQAIAHQAELQEIAAIEQWFDISDNSPKRITEEERTTDNPKWLTYLENRKIMKQRYDELVARIGE